jgi:tRNA (uracil-5-)-methyltransferase TRM9
MNAETRHYLISLNTDFYKVHGESFSNTRSSPWNGWEKTLKYLPKKPFTVLDIAAGNLRYLNFLKKELTDKQFNYTAIETSAPMLQNQEKNDITIINNNVLVMDFTSFYRTTDLVVCFGFMHHIPGFDDRIEFLKQLIEVLTPGGTLIISLWNFIQNNDYSKTIPWDSIKPGMSFEVETEDYLLGWKADNTCPRYCHNFTYSEVEKIKEIFSEYFVELWQSDGKLNNQNWYLVFQK